MLRLMLFKTKPEIDDHALMATAIDESSDDD